MLWNNFQAFKQYVSSLPENKQRGDYFEVFCLNMLKYYPVYYYVEQVFMYADFPSEEKTKLCLHQSDRGTDLIVKKKKEYVGMDGNQYIAVQCKFLTDEFYTYTDKRISTFLEDATRLGSGIFMSTQGDYTDFLGSENLPHRKIIQICMKEIMHLDNEHPEIMQCVLNAVYNFFHRRQIPEQHHISKNITMRPYQETCVNLARKYFVRNNRGLFSMATGAGKTWTVRWIVEQLINKIKFETIFYGLVDKSYVTKIIYVVPKLSLVSQNISIFTDKNVSIINFCSLKERNLSDVQVTTNENELLYFINQNQHKKKIIFNVTYASIEKFINLFSKNKHYFSVLIWDEAHVLTGTSKLSTWFAHENFDCVNKQIFMTATPKILKQPEGKHIIVVSMDNKNLFGNIFFNYSLRQGISEGYLSDYNIIIPVASTININTIYLYLKQNYNVFDAKDKEVIEDSENSNNDDEYIENNVNEANVLKIYWRDLINAFILKDSFDRGNKKQLCFSIYIKNAKMIAKILKLMYQLEDEEIFCEVVTCETKNIAKVLDDFRNTNKKAVILSSRVLVLGIDVPSVDAVCIGDPFESDVMIRQMIGRGTRKNGDKILDILLGVLAREEEDFENSDFSTVRNVLFALDSYDNCLIEQLQMEENKKLTLRALNTTLRFKNGHTLDAVDKIFDIQNQLGNWKSQILTKRELKLTKLDAFEKLIKWIEIYQRMPRRSKGRKDEEKTDELKKEYYFYALIINNQYDKQPQEIQKILDGCMIYKNWLRKNKYEKFKDLVEWIDTNQRMPRTLSKTRIEKLREQEDIKVLEKESYFNCFHTSNPYERQTREIQMLLDTCLIYKNWVVKNNEKIKTADNFLVKTRAVIDIMEQTQKIITRTNKEYGKYMYQLKFMFINTKLNRKGDKFTEERKQEMIELEQSDVFMSWFNERKGRVPRKETMDTERLLIKTRAMIEIMNKTQKIISQSDEKYGYSIEKLKRMYKNTKAGKEKGIFSQARMQELKELEACTPFVEWYIEYITWKNRQLTTASV